MGDPEMVSRAERAAVCLERAWERWRIMHGLSAEPTPPVSSYVGYSIEEPWGRPRVVFGVDAKEAELLAALLDRHECVGPFYEPSQPSDGQGLLPVGEGVLFDGAGVVPDGQGFFPVGEEMLLDGHAVAAAGDSPDLHRRDDGAEEPSETSTDYVSLNGAGERRRAEPADTDSAGHAAAGQAEPPGPADGDYQEVAGGFDQADGHDAGFAGGDPVGPAGSGYADVADGLLQAADGCDAGFAVGGPAQRGTPDTAGRAAGVPAEPAGGDFAGEAEPGVNDPAGPNLAGQAGPDLGGPEAEDHGNVSIAAELAGWAAGELPGQASARLAEWAAMGRAPRRASKPGGKPGVGAAGVGNR